MRRLLIIVLTVLMLLPVIGAVTAAEPADFSKIIIMHLAVNGGSITEKSVEMRYGHPSNLELRFGDFTGILKSSDGSIIREFDVWNPSYQLGDALDNDNNSSGYLTGYLDHSDNAELTLIIPYYENQMTFELIDKKTGALLTKVNMSAAITRFQTIYPKDPGGQSLPRFPFGGSVLSLIGGVIIFLLLTGTIFEMIRKK